MIKIIDVNEIVQFGTPELYSKTSDQKQHRTSCIIKRFGQFKPLLVEYDPNGVPHLIAGSSVLRALKHLEIPFAICFIFEGLKVSDHVMLNMIDNQYRDFEVVRFAKMLDLIKFSGEEVNYKALSNVLHHTPAEVKNFKDLKDFNWEDFDNDPTHFQHQLF